MREARKRLIVLSFLLGALVAAPVRAQQLLNTSFEDAETDLENPYNDLAAHWGRWGNWMNRECEWEPTHSGSCMIGYHHWTVQEETTSGLYQDVPGTPASSNIMFSVMAYKDPNTNAETIELRIEDLKNHMALGSQFYPVADMKTGGWLLLAVTAAANEPGIRVLIAVKPKAGGNRQGAIKFDDASLVIR